MHTSPPSRPSPITPTVDLNRDGIQHGHLRLPWSRDDSAWGSLMLPICVIRNGDGPTALLTGANHGDEYEGPVALYDLAANLKPEEIRGRVIIVPAMNYPAFLAGTRTSPIDKGNLNRSFPAVQMAQLLKRLPTISPATFCRQPISSWISILAGEHSIFCLTQPHMPCRIRHRNSAALRRSKPFRRLSRCG